ncbi:MAG: RNA polymerase sigma factor [Planctomycetes bacterium]|nr:RNA polymerase sigma factor [Planctomycetota bacterium]MBI3833905.1 RNA polymerase sigma factor [Planctomycetota bacterium]
MNLTTTLTETSLRAHCPRTAEFAAEFRASFRALWLIAAGIIGDASLAEDVVQEAAIIALEKLDQFTPGTNFKAWAGRIVRNVALNRARSERRRRAVTGNADSLNAVSARNERDSTEHPEHARFPDHKASFDSRVLAALESVTEIARACLLLRTLEGMEYSEIAAVLEIPEGTAMSHVHRTRQHLRERLATVWAERTETHGSNFDVGLPKE